MTNLAEATYLSLSLQAIAPGAMSARAECGSSAAVAPDSWMIKGDAPAPKRVRAARGTREKRPILIDSITRYDNRRWQMHIVAACDFDHVAALILQEFYYWLSPGESGNPRANNIHDGHNWVAMGETAWWDNMFIEEGQALGKTDKLAELGLIEIAVYPVKGIRTKHYRLTDAALVLFEGELDPRYLKGGCRYIKGTCRYIKGTPAVNITFYTGVASTDVSTGTASIPESKTTKTKTKVKSTPNPSPSLVGVKPTPPDSASPPSYPKSEWFDIQAFLREGAVAKAVYEKAEGESSFMRTLRERKAKEVADGNGLGACVQPPGVDGGKDTMH